MVRLATAAVVFGVLYCFLPYVGLEGMEPGDKVIYFHSKSCGHCKSFTPQWNDFAGATQVPHERVEAAEIESKGYGGLNIQGFPTVKLVGANKESKAEFSGERTKEGLDAWVATL